jgi:hypothetical protein
MIPCLDDTNHEYYQHPSNQLELSQSNIDLLQKKLHILKELYHTRYHTYHHSTTKIKAIWEEFNIPVLERPVLPTSLSDKDMLIVSAYKHMYVPW